MSLKSDVLKEQDRRVRDALRAERRALDGYVRSLKRARAAAVRRVRHQCRTAKDRTKRRASEIRAEHRVAANAEIARLRESTQTACDRGMGRAKRRGRKQEEKAQRTRRARLSDERLLTRRRDRALPTKRATRSERQRESDDEVRANLDADLLVAWETMRRTIRPRPRQSRTEAFLEWAEANPDEVLALQADSYDLTAKVKEFEAAAKEHARLAKTDPLAAIDQDQMRADGFDPNDPADVVHYLTAAAEYYDEQAAAVPF